MPAETAYTPVEMSFRGLKCFSVISIIT
uniref:Uncharacterized protein n=1 Tax=Anguilla anguilla TaxID=7936 RepID=A0A0E9TPI1_ANGAN